jgi:hypothetical protein
MKIEQRFYQNEPITVPRFPSRYLNHNIIITRFLCGHNLSHSLDGWHDYAKYCLCIVTIKKLLASPLWGDIYLIEARRQLFSLGIHQIFAS